MSDSHKHIAFLFSDSHEHIACLTSDSHEHIAFLIKTDSQKCTLHCFPTDWTLPPSEKLASSVLNLTASQKYLSLTGQCIRMFNLPDHLPNFKQNQVQRWELCFGPYGLQHRHFNWQLSILLSMAADNAMLTSVTICCQSGSTLQF